MDSKNDFFYCLVVPVFFYLELLCKLSGIKIPILEFIFDYFSYKKQYYKNYNNNKKYNNNKDELDTNNINISFLIELVSLLKKCKNKIGLNLSDYLEQLIEQLHNENHKKLEKRKKEDKQEKINPNYKLIFNKIEENIFEAIIKAKLHNILIDYYNNFCNKDKEKKLDDIKQINNQIIKNNINIFLEIDLDYGEEDIKSKDIIVIYFDIIFALLEENKNKDYEFVSNIIIQLDLENININEQSFNKFESILNIEKKCIKELIESEDFNDLKKIDFFSKILIYLIKNSLYEYNIKILKTKIYELFNIDFQDILIY